LQEDDRRKEEDDEDDEDMKMKIIQNIGVCVKREFDRHLK